MSLDLIQRFPTLVYQSESFNLEIKLREPGLIVFHIAGILNLKSAQTIVEHIQDFQKMIAAQSQMAFLIIQIEVSAKKSVPARAYLLRHLRWQTTGRIYGVYCVTDFALARHLLQLVGQFNTQTFLQTFERFDQALAAVEKKKTELVQNALEELQQVWNEKKAYRFQQINPRCDVRFFQPYDSVSYVQFKGYIGLQALEAIMPTFKSILHQLENLPGAMLVLDIRKIHGFDPKALFVPGVRQESHVLKNIQHHFIANTAQKNLIRMLRLARPSRYKKAEVFKSPQSIFKYLMSKDKLASELSLAAEKEAESVAPPPDWKALLTYQQEIIETQQESHLAQIDALKQVLLQILNHEGDTALKIQKPDRYAPINEVYELLEILHTDQVQMINDLHYQIELRSQAQQEASKASQVKSQFLAIVSHELRTPLNAILGFTHVLKRGQQGFSEKQQLYLERIAANSSHLLQVVNQLLDLSRIESQKLTLAPEPLRLRETVNEVLEQTEVLSQNKGLEIYLDIPADLVLTTDAQWFKQVLLNLLNNAIKYTLQGSVTVRAIKRDERQWVLQIQDTGTGIEPGLQAHIFEAFTSSDTHNDGVGLGLAISHSLCQLLGYTLRLAHSDHRCTCFEVMLGPL